MAIDPEIVIKRYNQCIDRGEGKLLKQVLNFQLFHYLLVDPQQATSFSHILSSIDFGEVNYLEQKELEVLSSFLSR